MFLLVILIRLLYFKNYSATEKDLHLYLDCEGAFEEEKACQIIFQVLKALEFLHSKHILHLDIKPENVLLMTPMSSKSNNGVDKDNENNDEPSSSSATTTVKPENNNNNVVSEPVKVKLCDFSFSQILTPGKTILGMMGTVAYSGINIFLFLDANPI